MSKSDAPPPTREQQREYLLRMKRTYEELDRQRRREWARLDYKANLPVLDGLLDMAYRHRRHESASGLVEWQRVVQRLGRAS